MKRLLGWGLALALAPAWGGTLAADEPTATAPAHPPRIDIDRLFDVPESALPSRPIRRGGRDREGWQDAFERARNDVSVLETRIDEIEAKLHAFVQPDNQYSPLGGAARSDPQVTKLRQQLDRDRQSLETARRRLRDLDIEAALAGVPSDWRKPSPPPPAPPDDGR